MTKKPQVGCSEGDRSTMEQEDIGDILQLSREKLAAPITSLKVTNTIKCVGDNKRMEHVFCILYFFTFHQDGAGYLTLPYIAPVV